MLLSDIFLIKSDHTHLQVITFKEKFTLSATLKHILPKLDQNFIQVHKYYVVNLNHIDAIDRSYVFYFKIIKYL